MEKRKFKDVYKSYKNCKNLTILSIVGLAGGTILTGSINFFIVAFYLTVMAYRGCKENYIAIGECDEYQRINQIYEYVLEELLSNMSNFDTISIEDIYAYYSYVINNGYLYAKRDMPLAENKILYERKILKALSLNNHGICRNLTPLLTDLINKKGYTAINLVCDALHEKREIDVEYTKEETALIFDDSKLREVAHIIGSKKMEIAIDEYVKKFPLRRKYNENHVITQAMDDTYTYYLDATNFEIYIPIQGREKEYISNMFNFMSIEKDPKRELKSADGLVTVYNLEEKEFKDAFEVVYNLYMKEKIFLENSDIFMNMYKEILPALEEAEDIYKRILIPQKHKVQ